MNKLGRVDSTVACFQAGHSCSQAVFSTYGSDMGMGVELAMKVSSGFGGGIARTGQFCGAVTGAIMVLGMRYGSSKTDEQSKEMNYAVIRKFLQEFITRNGSTSCRDLLGHDISTQEGRQLVKDKQLAKTICPGLVRDAAEIIEEILAASR